MRKKFEDEGYDVYCIDLLNNRLGFTFIKDIPYECNRGKNLYEGKEYILKL